MFNGRKMGFAIVAAAATVALAGCSTGPVTDDGAGGADDGEISLAGVFANTSDPLWAAAMCAAEARADELGIELNLSSIATADNTQLSTTIDTALLTSPDGLFVAGPDLSSYTSKFADLLSTGVPVVSNIPNEGSLTFAGALDKADAFAPQVVEQFSGLEGTAVILKGVADAQWQTDRLGAIVDALKGANPELRFVEDQIDGFDVSKGTQLISSVITANPDLKLVIGVAGPEGQAIAAAIEQTGVEGISAITFDGVPANIDALRKGTIQLILSQAVGLTGQDFVDILADYLQSPDYVVGDAIEPNSVEPSQRPFGLITPDNVDDADTQAYIYNPTC